MPSSNSSRILATPTTYAKSHYLYVQEVGSLQSISPHISRRDNLQSFLFFIVTKGSGSLIYHKQRHLLTAGDCVFLNCLDEYAHESSTEDPWELSWVHFYGKEASTLYQQFLDLGGTYLFHPGHLTLFLDTLHFLYRKHEKPENNTEILSHCQLTNLFSLCIKEIGSPLSETGGKIIEIQNYITSHFHKKLTLDELSDKYYISKFHLAREFKKQTGMTIGNYLTSARISHAKQLLRFTTLSLDAIAPECGFSDANYFVKAFKNAEGMTPGEYRSRW